MSNLKLREVIKQIRGCKTAAEERAVISKESALIRNAFKVSAYHQIIIILFYYGNSLTKKKKPKIEIAILQSCFSSIYWDILPILVNLSALNVLVLPILQKRGSDI